MSTSAVTVSWSPKRTAVSPCVSGLIGNARVNVGSREFDVAARWMFDRGVDEISLTAMEFDLMKAFIDHPNQVLDRDRRLHFARNHDWKPYGPSIDIRITRSRRKREAEPADPRRALRRQHPRAPAKPGVSRGIVSVVYQLVIVR